MSQSTSKIVLITSFSIGNLVQTHACSILPICMRNNGIPVNSFGWVTNVIRVFSNETSVMGLVGSTIHYTRHMKETDQ